MQEQQGKTAERERRDWIIILVILLFGFLCLFLAGGWAVRFDPGWRLDTNMKSNLDPDSDFLTNRPVSYFEPLDPSILTQPVWVNIYLTPGAIFQTRTPPPPPTNPPTGTNTPLPTAINSPTATRFPSSTPVVILPSLTRTPSNVPPATSTPGTLTATPLPTTSTPVPPATAVPVDLSIAKDDGVTAVNPGATITYTVRVTNNGPNNVTGAILSDPAATGLTKTAVGCSPTPGQCVTPPTIAQLESGSFGLPPLNNGQFYEITVSATVNATNGSVTNTASITAPAGYTDANGGNNSASDTDTVNMLADLQITKTDNSTHYVAGATKTYVIIVSNAGPSNVTGATVTDNFSANPNIVSASWTCFGAGGAVCSAAGSGDINDMVNLPVGSSVTYMVTANVSASPSGDLVNTAAVTVPAGITDPAPGNNSATDTDFLITTNPLPPNMGTKDNVFYTLPSGSTLTLNINLTANGDAAWDLVFYEYSVFPMFDGIWLDWIIIEISDGNNWYRIFNWGDNIRDTNTNVDYAILTVPVTPPTPEEVDQRPVASGDLYNGSGIAINIDGIVPLGNYTFIRFYAPPGDVDGGTEIDAIEILP